MTFAFNICLHLNIMNSNIQCFWIRNKQISCQGCGHNLRLVEYRKPGLTNRIHLLVTWQNSMDMKSSLTEISTHSLGDGQQTATLQECVWSCSVTGLLIMCVWDVLLEWAASLFTRRRWAVQINGAVHEKGIWNFRHFV